MYEKIKYNIFQEVQKEFKWLYSLIRIIRIILIIFKNYLLIWQFTELHFCYQSFVTRF